MDLGNEYSKLANDSVVPLRVIYHLKNVLEVGSPKEQFLTSNYFCGLRPMRSVNARIICLIGMNEGAFPRQTSKFGFDLSGIRKAETDQRDDDRYLFLETLWCTWNISI